MTLPKRTLGRTGLEVTTLGYGAMELRGAPRGPEISDDDARQVLNAVLDAGINFVDTSPDYGRSEELIGRFISGRPSIIVQSMPGAGGVRMLNAAARIMPGDGTQLFVPPDTMVLTQLLAKDGVQFDARQFHYLGTINQQNNFFVVRREVSTSLDALKRREVVVGHSGNGSAGHLITSIAGESLGLKLRLIAGYEGSRDTLIAFERKEIDGGTFGWQTWAQSVPHWFVGQASFAVPMFQVGIRPDPDMPHVPLLGSLVKQHDHALVGLIDTQGQIGRTLAAPPGTPKELVAQLRSSLEAMVADTREAAVWSLSDALLEGDAASALRIGEQLIAQGENVTGLVYGLASRLRSACAAAAQLEDGVAPKQVEASLKMHPYAAKLLVGRVRDADLADLRAATETLAELELWCRGEKDYGDELALTLALRSMAGAGA